MRGNIIAVFDLDGTIIIGRSIENAFIKYLLKTGKIPFSNILTTIMYYLKNIWKDPVEAVKRNKMYLKGISMPEVSRWVEEFVKKKADALISLRIIEHVKDHKKIGHTVILLTGDIDILVDPLPFHKYFDYVFTTKLEVRESIYTGHIKGPHYYGKIKVDAVISLADRLDADLSQSYCYSDSGSDIDLMCLFGHPVTVNPDRKLTEVARQRHWEINANE
jgi:putative phosphoserine phosphatase/1-acylglycerol-3-phosphate O-acyltransferase